MRIYILLSPQEEEVHSSSCGNRCTHLAPHSSKRLNPLSIIILVCLSNIYIKKQDCKTNCFIIGPPSLDFWYSYWWIGPISSITSSHVYTKWINSTTQTRNSAALWWLLWYQVILYSPNIFGISIFFVSQDIFKQSFLS